jgi:hypothetical protein
LHYKRYENQDEFPVILQVETQAVLDLNPHEPEFCQYNSGSSRCHDFFPEGTSPRGPNTFMIAADFDLSPSKVREITFPGRCRLPGEIITANHPDELF